MRRICRVLPSLLLMVVAISFFLTACSDISLKSKENEMGVPPIVVTSRIPAQTPTVTSHPTNASTIIPTATIPNIVTAPPNPLMRATPAPTVALLPEGWQLDWLQGKPCQLPCWEWLQPGTTLLDDAVVLLKQYPPVDAASITFSGDGTEGLKGLGWNWKGQRYGGSLSYETDTSNHLVKLIYLQMPGSLKLKDLIQIFGEPSHIDANGTDSIDSPGYFYSLDLIWEKQGLQVLFSSAVKTVPVLSPELTSYTFEGLSFITIVAPGNLKSLKSGEYADTIKGWQGFKPFGYYCLDYHTGKPCP